MAANRVLAGAMMGLTSRQIAKLGIGRQAVRGILDRNRLDFQPVKESLARQCAIVAAHAWENIDIEQMPHQSRVILAGVATDKVIALTKSDAPSQSLTIQVGAADAVARLQSRLSGQQKVIDLPPVEQPVVSHATTPAIIGVSGTSSHNKGCISPVVSDPGPSRGRGSHRQPADSVLTSPVTPKVLQKGSRKGGRSVSVPAKMLGKKVCVGPPAWECY